MPREAITGTTFLSKIGDVSNLEAIYSSLTGTDAFALTTELQKGFAGDMPTLFSTFEMLHGIGSQVTICADGSVEPPCLGDSIQGNSLGGVIAMSVGGENSTFIPFDSTSREVTEILEALHPSTWCPFREQLWMLIMV